MADSKQETEKKRKALVITISIVWIIIFGSIILALRFGLISNQQIQVIQSSTKDKIDVSGYAEVSEKADVAEIYLGVETQNLIASTSQKENANIMQKVYREIYSYAKKEDVETYSLDLSPLIDWKDGQEKIIGYKTTHILKIKSGVNDAGKIIDNAVNAGANKINSIVFALTDARKESVGAEALKKAISDARKKALITAEQMGVTLKKPVYITAGYSYVTPYYAAYKEMASASTQILAGSVKVTASISVSYGFE
ncbi:SIMPL domain-containing protein [Candidatus Pacearchaeota archaeon]|nr:SIMPL domain-containing protein [Candidatus Pacearchaeota archaeon]